jgi:hypothetical protein
MHHFDHGRLRAVEQIVMPDDRHGVEEDAEIDRALVIGRENPALELAQEAVDRLRPLRVANHDIAGAGRKPEFLQRIGEAVAKGLQLVLRHRTRQQQAVVLIRAHGLLAASFRAHHHETSGLANGRRCDQGEHLREQAAIEIGGDFRDHLDPGALLVEALDLALDVAGAEDEIVDRAGALDMSGDELRIAGHQPENVDVLEDADILSGRLDCEPALVVMRHRDDGVEDEIIDLDRGDVEMADIPDLGRQGMSVEDDPFCQIRSGDDSDRVAFAHQKRVVVVFAHGAAGLLDRGRPVHEHRRTKTDVAHAGAQDRIDAAVLASNRVGAELAGNLRIEECGESGVLRNQLEHERLGQEIAERLVGRDETGAGGAVHERTRIERVLRPEHGLHFFAVALLDRALDHDMQVFGTLTLLDDRFARTEIADVERTAQIADLVVGQSIEGRILRIEGLRH